MAVVEVAAAVAECDAGDAMLMYHRATKWCAAIDPPAAGF